MDCQYQWSTQRQNCKPDNLLTPCVLIKQKCSAQGSGGWRTAPGPSQAKREGGTDGRAADNITSVSQMGLSTDAHVPACGALATVLDEAGRGAGVVKAGRNGLVTRTQPNPKWGRSKQEQRDGKTTLPINSCVWVSMGALALGRQTDPRSPP